MTESENTQPQIQFNVLLIGDSCIDKYHIGTVDRLSPEAPVPVFKIVDSYEVQGMAANVYLNLVNMKITPDFITNSEIITKNRYIDKRSGQHLLRVDDEGKIMQWDQITPQPLDAYDAIVISDYNKGFLSYQNIEHIISAVKCPIFIDTKKRDLAKFSAENVFVKINETEYKNRISSPLNLIVTLGDKGATLKTACYEDLFQTKQVEVMDVCGCGDTFLSALTAQYLFTKNPDLAIMFANAAAGITVQHRGNYAPAYEEVKNAGY